MPRAVPPAAAADKRSGAGGTGLHRHPISARRSPCRSWPAGFISAPPICPTRSGTGRATAPSKYILLSRLSYARELLLTTGDGAAVVAARCGLGTSTVLSAPSAGRRDSPLPPTGGAANRKTALLGGGICRQVRLCDDGIKSRAAALCYVNAYSVTEWNAFPAFSTVVGNPGWFGLSGKNWVSMQKPWCG